MHLTIASFSIFKGHAAFATSLSAFVFWRRFAGSNLRPHRPHRSQHSFQSIDAGRLTRGRRTYRPPHRATVRSETAARLMTLLPFGPGADDADGVDGLSTRYSGTTWLGAVVDLDRAGTCSSLALGSRSQCRSCAGRLPPDAIRPDSALGLLGHVLDFDDPLA